MRTTNLFALILTLILAACGGKDENTTPPTPCASSSVEEGVIIACPGHEPVLIRHGTNGRDGIDGAPGMNGQDGIDGANGRDGTDGQDGMSCILETRSDLSVWIVCDDGQEHMLQEPAECMVDTDCLPAPPNARTCIGNIGYFPEPSCVSNECRYNDVSVQNATWCQPARLTCWSESNPQGKIVIAGSTGQVSSNYRCHASGGSVDLKYAYVNNDLFGLFDNPQSTGAVSSVTVEVSDGTQLLETRNCSLAGGLCSVNLTSTVLDGQDIFLSISADVTTMQGYGEGLSGKEFRLGLSNLEFTENNRGNRLTLSDGIGIENSDQVDIHTVRKTRLYVDKVLSGLSANIVNGAQNRLFGFTVTADNAGPGTFSRITLPIQTIDMDSPGADIFNFKLYLGESHHLTSANIIGQVGHGTRNLEVTGLADGANGVATNQYLIIVTFDTPQVIQAGQTHTYYFDAAVDGAISTSNIYTYISWDETPLVGISDSNGNPNTGRVASVGGIFPNNGDFWAGYLVARSFIWSDMSADLHSYPTIVGGIPVLGSGSYDWTNGYQLDLTQAPGHSLSL